MEKYEMVWDIGSENFSVANTRDEQGDQSARCQELHQKRVDENLSRLSTPLFHLASIIHFKEVKFFESMKKLCEFAFL
ncbi:hypothetical protein M6B38_387520 [Iris pallida]|uniref:Uncharacterized protein n=1 Tax=Iris pallida TaxID=29817 RepID=A0AAX6G278_IRIPA|nr:hypothetical protein M6B38_387520 [Iris pallida]